VPYVGGGYSQPRGTMRASGAGLNLPAWPRTLRRWQHDAVAWWARERPRSSLAVVTPGGGKSLYAAAVAYGAFGSGLIDGVIVVVPSDHLRSQMALTFAGVGIQLDPYLVNGDGMYARDLLGAVVTIHQVALEPRAFARIVGRRRIMVVIDEVHHAGDNRRWGAGIESAFGAATFIVALSGTPFRSDGSGISFLTYDRVGRVEADVVYGYRDALRDGIVRPLVFHRQGGEVTWTGADGSANTATFEAALAKQRSSERLRAALYDASWVSEVIVRANGTLEKLRRTDRDAGGIIVCIDEAHARWVSSVMAEALGFHPTVVVSADAAAGAKIKRFTDGTDPWLCAVRMVSEGVDIPRARVLPYLTNARTELFFRQMIGRVVRARNASTAASYVMLPDDPELRTFAVAIEEDVKGSRSEAAVGIARKRGVIEAASQFESHAAIHEESGVILGESSAAALGAPGDHAGAARLVAPATLAPVAPPPATLLADQKQHLRRNVWVKVGEVSRRFRKEQRDVYAYWARRDNATVSNATEVQLEARLRSMDSWLREGFCPVQ
jgi:superfamily II DNA or RNA helicase